MMSIFSPFRYPYYHTERPSLSKSVIIIIIIIIIIVFIAGLLVGVVMEVQRDLVVGGQ